MQQFLMHDEALDYIKTKVSLHGHNGVWYLSDNLVHTVSRASDSDVS